MSKRYDLSDLAAVFAYAASMFILRAGRDPTPDERRAMQEEFGDIMTEHAMTDARLEVITERRVRSAQAARRRAPVPS
jgi:hypothetical protein